MNHTALLGATAKPSKSVTVSGKSNDTPTNATAEQNMPYRPAYKPKESSASGRTSILVNNKIVVIPPASIPAMAPELLLFFQK